MAKIISVAIQKGGTGKTSTSVNLSVGLKLKGKKVLLVDMDSQANSSINLDAPTTYSLMDHLVDNKPIEEIIVHTEYCDIIPSNFNMSDFENQIIKLHRISPDKFLKKTLKNIESNYDYIIIDCPPALNFQTINALATSQSVLIVLEPSEFSMEGLKQFFQIYETAEEEYGLKIEGILFNKVNKQTKEFKKLWAEVSSMFPDIVYDFYIPQSQAVPQSQSFKNFKDNKPKPCITEFPHASASEGYKKLVDKIIQ